PWLSCSLASRTNVFMVGICDAASNLHKLALPSEDLYIDMEYFHHTTMNELVNKVIAKTCDCATQGSIPSSTTTASTATETPVTETESSNATPSDTMANGTTESPPLPSPHCFGDFIFVIDGSTDISQSVRIYS
uniref:VWFA domain-containing protein n=2 Tax=Parascaris univalens TaxID=6257 RepID=A0A915ALI1_PARUN